MWWIFVVAEAEFFFFKEAELQHFIVLPCTLYRGEWELLLQQRLHAQFRRDCVCELFVIIQSSTVFFVKSSKGILVQ